MLKGFLNPEYKTTSLFIKFRTMIICFVTNNESIFLLSNKQKQTKVVNKNLESELEIASNKADVTYVCLTRSLFELINFTGF